MLRLARSATLLVAFSLLTSAATASAECAWVLWTKVGSAGPWDIGHATPSRADCLVALERTARGLKEVILGDVRAGSFTAVEQATGNSYFGKCLPDTVDPRGASR